MAYVSGIAAATGDEQGRRLEKIQKRLEEEQQKLESLAVRERDLFTELSALEADITEREKTLRTLEKGLKESDNEMRVLQRELEGSFERMQAIRLRLRQRLTLLYKFIREGYLKLIVTAPDLRNLIHRAEYLKVLMRGDDQALDELSGRLARQQQEILRLEEAIQEVERAREAAFETAADTRMEMEAQVVELMRVHQEKRFYETAVKELQAAEEEIRQKLDGTHDAKLPAESRFSDFRAFKGRLPFPIQGRIVKFHGSAVGEFEGLQKGVFIDGGGNTGVRAVFPGRIDFSGTLKGYGGMIIINHGGRFFSIMGNLGELHRDSGDWVEIGDTLGRVAAGRPLYFEIRQGIQNLDPRDWLN